MKKIGIIDEPIAQGKLDHLDINVHSDSLIRFIKETNTPITIGIQGEWGSGKTSLINSIHHALDTTGDGQYQQIWINSWEYSLLSSPEETLIKIVNKIIQELLKPKSETSFFKQRSAKKVASAALKVFEGALRVGASAVAGAKASEVAAELFSKNQKTISELKKQLEELVKQVKDSKENPFQKVIIYVDDLDRIEPKNAVAILELLKNIFSVPNCVFILAIDYQVVVKGLEHKFGKQTAENEWEFRAFFDKIIQLPFMMPMGQYNIGKYVENLLIDIGFVESKDLADYDIREIILRTIGGNPRSIKRLVNSVSLIQIFTETKINQESNTTGTENIDDDISDEDKKFLLFSLLCLQIAHPYIYSLLTEKPNFTEWDENFAQSQTMKKEMIKEDFPQFETEFENAQKTDDFNEAWEKALFRICYIKPRLKPRTSDISKFFSYIKDVLLNNDQDLIGALILETLDRTSVTSVTSADKQQNKIPKKIHGQPRILDNFETFIKKELSESKLKGIEKILEDIRSIHDTVSDEFNDITWQYSGGVSGSVNGHKFITIYSYQPKSKIHLLRHKDNDYKIPKINNIETVAWRTYKQGKITTANGSEKYSIRVANGEFEANKEIIMKLIRLSYDMAKLHWDEKLNINLKSSPPKVTGKGFDQNNNSDVEQVALKYLNNEYTYNVEE